MTSLRARQPVSCRGQWRDTFFPRDRETGEPIPLDHADSVTVSLFRAGEACCPRLDYGRLTWSGSDRPVLTASTADGSGIVRFVREASGVEWVFPAERVAAAARPGAYEISVVVVMNGQTDEAMRERVTFY